MLSQKLIVNKSKNFTSSCWISRAPTVPVNHYPFYTCKSCKTNKIIDRKGLVPLSHAQLFKRLRITIVGRIAKTALRIVPCFEHSNFFKVNRKKKNPTIADRLSNLSLKRRRWVNKCAVQRRRLLADAKRRRSAHQKKFRPSFRLRAF